MATSLPNASGLTDSAQRFARRALEFHYTENFELVSICAATALEHITKACLVSKHPTLILEANGRDNFRNLLYLNGIIPDQPENFRTVGLTDALKRLRTLVTSSATENQLKKLIDLRDGNIHIADTAVVETDLLVPFIVQIDACLNNLGINREDFWGEYLSVSDSILSAHLTEVAREVAIRISQSQVRFERKKMEMPPDALTAFINFQPNFGFGEEVETCPVCETSNSVSGYHEVLYDDSSDEIDPGAEWNHPAFFPEYYVCRLCGLELVNPDELKEAGFPSIMESSFDSDQILRIEYLMYPDRK